jgi:glycosyltransferase involved in cell wall biosynthesis
MQVKISVLIPCRNEAQFIGRCLDSILGNSCPKESMEVLVIDGMSGDTTREIVERYASRHGFIKMLDNPAKIVPVALNIGIKKASGEIILRMDAHSIYDKEYISNCIKYLQEYQADNVGGVCITVPGKQDMLSTAIALGLSSRFGVGNSLFRVGVKGPRYVDTVPFGCYRREVFEKIGFFDEDLVRNQDDEFNARLIRNGGTILLHPAIKSYYNARTSLGKLWRMYYQYGYFKPLVAQKIGAIVTWRQLVPCFFVTAVAASAGLSLVYSAAAHLLLLTLGFYILANLGFSLSTAFLKNIKLFFLLPAVYATLHFSYGLGFQKGIWDFMVLKRSKQKRGELPLTR